MNHKLNIKVARGAMKTILNKTHIDAARSLGCTEKEWGLVTGTNPWKANERNIVKRLMDNLVNGMMDTMGLVRFKVPAEYIASVITAFVSDCNTFAACQWMENTYKAEDMGNFDGSMGAGEMEIISDSRLFALVCALKSDEQILDIANEYARKCDVAIALATGEPNEAKA